MSDNANGTEPGRKRPVLFHRLSYVLAVIAMLVILAAIAGAVTVHVGTRKYLCLHHAVSSGDLFAVRCFLWRHADVNEVGDEYCPTPLHFAALNGHTDVTALLLEKGADVNATSIDDVTPLFFAAAGNHREVAAVLIENGADVNTKEKTLGRAPLHVAAREGYKGVVALLLEKGADVNAEDKDGNTPLDVARAEEIRELLRQAARAAPKAEIPIPDTSQ